MKTIQAHTGLSGKRGARAFTMIEIMISLLILGILLALLIGSVKLVTRTAKGTVDRAAVNEIQKGASQFKQLFGFYIPLVRERDPGNAVVIEPIPNANPARNRVSVHKPQDADFLDDLQANNFTVNPLNPLLDERYSERSIAIYLAGVLPSPVFPAQPQGLPIDGVNGPGFCKPLIDGSFAIPADLLHPGAGADATKRTGQTYEPFIQLGASGLRFEGSAAQPDAVTIIDRSGVPIRYYRWEHKLTDLANPYRVPLMVGRNASAIPGFPVPESRDLSKNANLRTAAFAIVSAGPDGVFGDEQLDVICQKLGISLDPSSEVKIRMRAEQDNVVEVGS
jgi:prepilin-type N-terminal cleavage/methylation domain-containing protein